MSEDEKVVTAPEDKIQELIVVMRGALAQEGIPQFKTFWNARNEFHEVLKECKNPLYKSKMWKELSDMTAEARRVKEILDEEARFAVEQIELAIKAFDEDLEKEIQSVKSVEVPAGCSEIEKFGLECKNKQMKIARFTTLMTRIKEMRGEIIQTEMRVKHKNRLLKEISAIGDRFIPERKQLIEEISDDFKRDVESFFTCHFSKESSSRVPLRELREQIKDFQQAAKTYSINSRVFKETREILSEAWETINKRFDEKRVFFEEKREVFDKNLEEVKKESSAFLEKTEGWDLVALIGVYNRLEKLISEKELDRRDKQEIMREIDKVYRSRKEVLDKQEAEKRAKIAVEQEKKRIEFENAIAEGANQSMDELKALRDTIIAEGPKYRNLVQKVDFAILKKDGKSGGALTKWLEIEKIHRKKLGELRKKMGQSGFDFESAMEARAEYDATRERLAEIEMEIGKLR